MNRPLLLAVTILCTACPGTLEDPARFLGADDPAACDVPRLFQQSCAGGICHSPGDPAAGLDLVSADVACRIVGVASGSPRARDCGADGAGGSAAGGAGGSAAGGAGGSAAGGAGGAAETCGGTLVAPGDPEGSLLWQKLQDAPTCGDPMPAGAALSAAELACVRAFLLDPG